MPHGYKASRLVGKTDFNKRERLDKISVILNGNIDQQRILDNRVLANITLHNTDLAQVYTHWQLAMQ